MDDLHRFKDFFGDLSHDGSLVVEIRDSQGKLLWSSGLKAKATGILDGSSPQRTARLQESEYRMPIRDDQHIFGSLVARGMGSTPGLGTHGQPLTVSPESDNLAGLLQALAGLMSDNLTVQQEMDQMTSELANSFEDLHTYANLAHKIRSLHLSAEMLETLLKELRAALRADLAFAWLPRHTQYKSYLTTPEADRRIADVNAFGETLIAAMAGSAAGWQEHFFIVNDSGKSPEFRELHPDPFRFLAVPIRRSREFYGYLGLLCFNMSEIFRRGEMQILASVAAQIAMVILNTDLYRDLEDFVINMVKSLVSAIEAKDPYTRGHSERVNRLCLQMAKRLNLDVTQQKIINWASILHDIGKIGIPERILNKPERLTDEEYTHIQQHPQKGCNILRPLSQIADVLPGILHHHERCDGKGYPHGLRGGQIPLHARLIAIADTFDAISSNRAYRSAQSREKALAIVTEVAGTQLDAELVKLFACLYREKII